MSKTSILYKLALTRLPTPIAAFLNNSKAHVVDGRAIDPKAHAYGELFNSVRQPGETPTLEASRRSLSVLAERFDRKAAAHVNKRDLSLPGAEGARPARMYDCQSLDAKDRPVLLFFHGGGWVQGDLETHDGLCAQIAEDAGIRVLALDYRLAPENPFPAGLDDCRAAYLALRSDPQTYGIDPARIAVGGDSAGGNLTAAMMHDLQEEGADLPAAQVLIYPAVDTRMQTRSMQALPNAYVLPVERIAWYLEQYFGEGTDPSSPRAAPIFSPHLPNQPPAVIIAAGHDPLWDDALSYAAALEAAGVEASVLRYEGQIHAFMSMRAVLPQGEEATREVSAWLKQRLG